MATQSRNIHSEQSMYAMAQELGIDYPAPESGIEKVGAAMERAAAEVTEAVETAKENIVHAVPEQLRPFVLGYLLGAATLAGGIALARVI